jgi:hypothetical protein
MALSLLWVFFSVAAGLFASIRCNRNGIGWFFVAVFFSPLVAFVLLFILLPLDPPDLLVLMNRKTQRDAALWQIGTAGMTAILVVSLAFTVLMILVFSQAAKAQQQQVIRDAAGRIVGTATTSAGTSTSTTTVLRDASGRTIGTATEHTGTDTVLRDASGRTIGSVERKRP